MALTFAHITFIYQLRKLDIVGGEKTRSILEFGEQNWFGDVHPREIGKLIDDLCDSDEEKRSFKERLDHLLESDQGEDFLFQVAKLFYSLTLNYDTYRAVDLHGTSDQDRHDLNLPLPFEEKFDIVTNIGTAEHVFNQYQFFRSMHERTKPGGIMLHYFPNQGYYDHGFYNYHPTFVFDLCIANGYEATFLNYIDVSSAPPALIPIKDRASYVKMAVEGRLGNDSGLLALIRMSREETEFKSPMQGYYANALPPELVEAWKKLSK